MHGIILVELRKFVEAEHGTSAWREVLDATSLRGQTILSTKVYSDEASAFLFREAARVFGNSEEELLEALGRKLVPGLLDVYGALVEPGWKTLDVIEHCDKVIHKVTRLHDPRAKPPRITVARTAPTRAEVVYRSKREMCSLAKGICRGLAERFGERVVVSESGCMRSGAAQCDITVQLEEGETNAA